MNYKPFSFISKDGLTLQCRAWISDHNQARGIIHLLHDLGEHSAYFSHVAECFCENGYHFLALDLRGHGLSDGRRGHTPSYTHLMNDIAYFIRCSNEKLKLTQLPIILYGHGFGGNLVLNYILRRQPHIAGVIATSPMLAPPFKVSKLKTAALKIIANIFPRHKFRNRMKSEYLSRDIALAQAYSDDVFNHNYVTARLGLEIFRRGKYAIDNAHQWNLPLLLLHGTEDRICAPSASQIFAKKAGSFVDLVLLESFYHEIHNDLQNDFVIEKMLDWVKKEIK
ncbi:MAG: alpha/beta hydrolase [Chloroflexota bacterium]|nr:alpha/beta hydrolase [Chloroflexota bacterium]